MAFAGWDKNLFDNSFFAERVALKPSPNGDFPSSNRRWVLIRPSIAPSIHHTAKPRKGSSDRIGSAKAVPNVKTTQTPTNGFGGYSSNRLLRTRGNNLSVGLKRHYINKIKPGTEFEIVRQPNLSKFSSMIAVSQHAMQIMAMRLI